MADLELQNIHKSFGEVEVIKGITLGVEHGEFVVFVGPSGCGKSTLLRLIAGLEDITEGILMISGRRCNDIEPRDRGVAMVFQSYALYPHMTVYDNVGFGLKLAKAPKDVRDRKIREAARILQMEALLDRKPRQLSGGQRQRVAIGRAIVREPEVFLFDEPLSNLDAALRVSMRQELSKLHQSLGATMIYVTHDQVEAMTLADKIVVLDAGVVQQIGTPMELYSFPANLFVAGFIGSPKMNFMEVEVLSSDSNQISISAPGLTEAKLPVKPNGAGKGDHVTLGIRPHDLRQDEAGQVEGTVKLIERLGNETIVDLTLTSGEGWLAALDGDVDVSVGDSLRLSLSPDKARLFEASGRALRVSGEVRA